MSGSSIQEIIRQEIVHEVLGKTAGSRKDLGMVHVQDVCALMEKRPDGRSRFRIR